MTQALGQTRLQDGELLARRALLLYDFSPRATLQVVNAAGPYTFMVDDPGTDTRAALRLHRPGYHDRGHLKSELQWLDALRSNRAVEVPPPITARNGDRVVQVDGGDGPQLVTVNGWVDGKRVDPAADLADGFMLLGAATAELHAHVATWTLPPGFCRPTWGVKQLLGPRPAFGPWRAGLGMGPAELDVLERAEAAVRDALASFPTGPGHCGLVHADLRLENLRIGRRGRMEVFGVIDFDDCGHSWLMYDFGSAVSFVEDHPRMTELMAAWVRGYRTVRALPEGAEDQLATFVMLRRLVLTGWVAQHHETIDDAAALGTAYTAGSCDVAERYLTGQLG